MKNLGVVNKFKQKYCKFCKKKFTPVRPLQQVCCSECAYLLASRKLVEKIAKENRIWKKETKEKLKTHKDYLNDLQKVFNTFIRLRDAGRLCISCSRPLLNKFDAGHFYSVGGNPALRFNEDNVHGQCVHCNRDKHGNLIEYGERLILRIGKERLERLKTLRNEKSKPSIPELRAKIVHYKMQIKILSEK